MSWITVDTGLPDHAKMAALPSDAARWGWLVTLCKAKEQRRPGTFASERHYRHVLPRHGRFLADYIKAGLMDRAETGSLHVHDWQRHQWAATKAHQRGTTNGQVEDFDETNLGQERDSSRVVGVSVPVDVLETTEGVQGKPPDPFEAYWLLTTRYPKGGGATWLDKLTTVYGPGPVIRTLASKWAERSDSSTLLSRTEDALLRDARQLDVQAQAAVKEQLDAKRAEPRIVPDRAAVEAEVQRILRGEAA